MPRGPRLDVSGILHHVMVRGRERRALLRDDRDRADVFRRLAALAARGGLIIYAWALLPKHAHLLGRAGARPWPGACAPSAQELNRQGAKDAKVFHRQRCLERAALRLRHSSWRPWRLGG